MDIATLLTSLTLAGLSLRLGNSGSIEVVGPVQSLTLDQQQAIATHSPTLAIMLTRLPTCYFPDQDERDAIQFADTPEALPQLSDAIEFFSQLADDMGRCNPEALAQIVIEQEPQLTPCIRCQSVKTYLAIIHAGESLRRDCAKCGRFVEFPAWHDRVKVGELLTRITWQSRYNKERTAQVVEHLSSPDESLCIRKENADG